MVVFVVVQGTFLTKTTSGITGLCCHTSLCYLQFTVFKIFSYNNFLHLKIESIRLLNNKKLPIVFTWPSGLVSHCRRVECRVRMQILNITAVSLILMVFCAKLSKRPKTYIFNKGQGV